MARTVTLSQACGIKGVSSETLVAALNDAIKEEAGCAQSHGQDAYRPAPLTIGGRAVTHADRS
jgi:hypothetical protein